MRRVHAVLTAMLSDDREPVTETLTIEVEEGNEDQSVRDLADWLRALAGQMEEVLEDD